MKYFKKNYVGAAPTLAFYLSASLDLCSNPHPSKKKTKRNRKWCVLDILTETVTITYS